jgi:predicted oxidoreductase
MEEIKKEREKKPFNVVLLGNIESEKASLLHKIIKKRLAIKQLNEIKMNEELVDSNIDDVMNSVEIHGETIKMKIWDNVSANKIFSSSNKILKIAQGIILF